MDGCEATFIDPYDALDLVRRALKLEPRDLSFQKLEFRLRVMKVLHGVRGTGRKVIFWKR